MMGPDELGRLLDSHGGALILAARSWCASAEDVVQEAFLKLASRRPSPSDPVAWLYRVVRNAAISAGRSERRRIKRETHAASSEWFIAPDESPLDADVAAKALAGLPPEEREVIALHLWGGHNFAAIGALTGTSAATAHRRYVAGLARLRERLETPCPNRDSPTS
ncbi:MAG: RNA polymerase sigma factor [Gemmataceae bacterium]